MPSNKKHVHFFLAQCLLKSAFLGKLYRMYNDFNWLAMAYGCESCKLENSLEKQTT